MVRHLASIAEIVEDFDAAVSLYRDTLGLQVEVHHEGYADVTLPGDAALRDMVARRSRQSHLTAARTPLTVFRSASQSALRWTMWQQQRNCLRMPK